MLNNIAIDAELVENGVWVQLQQSWFLIASVENNKFKAAIFDHGRNQFTDDEFCSLLANFILLGWKDVKQPDGSDLSYSKEMAKIALLSNDDVRMLVDHVSTNLKYFASKL